uniref:Protein decapping 5 n=1 Tax=Kalanchoe fedtschenkoi TaxID=63787 RepID=A0A7N0T6A1_KALFE
MAAEGSRSGSAADSYIGSLISLTSKSEMRYEGVLYNINTDESSIGLQNVRSFGTEGRKKDGPQVPPSDKVYEYILFRGSDIKDLQVKSSPAAQTSPLVNSDTVIIQSQHPRPDPASTSLPAAVASTAADTSLQTSQLGMPGSYIQNGAPLYQPGGSVGSWGPSPPSANGSGIGMPMSWQGYYSPPNGLPFHQYQQPLMRPPGLSMPLLPQQQQMPSSLQQQMPSSLQQQMPSSLQPQMPSSLQPQLPSSLQRQMPSLQQLTSSSPQQQMPSFQLQMPSSFQHPLQYPSYSVPLPIGNSSLPAVTSLYPFESSTGISTSISPPPAIPSSLTPTSPLLPLTSLTSDTVSSSIPIKAPIAASLPGSQIPVTSLSPASSLLSPGLDANALLQPLSSKLIATTASPAPQQTANVPQSVLSTFGAADPISTQAPAPALLTPGHLLKSSSISSVPSSQTVHKDVEVVQVSSSPVPKPPSPADSEVKPPILPLPTPSRPIYKPNGAPAQSYYGYRGRGRGRGRMNSRPLTTFSEEFDFTSMNEKFKKDEVWGHLGKSSKSHDQEEDEHHGGEEFSKFQEVDMPKIDIKPIYNKDDFFDSLSSDAQDQESNHGRHRFSFSEQRKIDTETFGEFSRYRGGRGGRGPGRGGVRYRGSFYGRDHGRGGYGYGRGRGRGGPN